MEYKKRISDKLIKEYLNLFGAVVIEGPKWCGKTSSGKKIANSIFELTASSEGINNKIIAENDMPSVLAGPYPRLIDEWQEVPPIWDAARHKIDSENKKGLFIFAGSSTPNDNLTVHSGAGRFGRVKMSTMSLSELGISSKILSLKKLLYNRPAQIPTSTGKLSLDDVINLICVGGWPGLLNISTNPAQKILRNYVETLTNEDISRVDGSKKDPKKIRALFESLSRNTASLVSKETILKDIENNGRSTLSIVTIDDYLDILRRAFILEEIPAWNSAIKSTVRLRSAPKRILVDPSLAVASLETNPTSLKKDLKFVGNLFENLVLHDLLIYAQAAEAKVYHYNDNSNLEIDAIIDGLDGSWGAIEIKLSPTGEEEGAKNLLRLKDKIDTNHLKNPSFLMVITGVGGVLRRREDGVIVAPIDCLGE